MLQALLFAYLIDRFPQPSAVIPPVGAAGLVVESQDITPGSVPRGASRVPFLALTLRASCDAPADIRSITLRHRGAGPVGDFAGVYALRGDTRLGSPRTVRRDGTAELQMRSFVIPAYGTERVLVLGDLIPESAIAAEHRFLLTSVDASGATVRISTIAAQSSDPVRTAGLSVGAVSVEVIAPLSRVRYGSARPVARLRLSVDGERDHLLHAITLVNEGSASGEHLQQLAIVSSDGKRLTAVTPQLSDDRTRLVFDPPLLVRRGDVRLVTLRADVRSGASRTVRFAVEDPADVEVVPVWRRRE